MPAPARANPRPSPAVRPVNSGAPRRSSYKPGPERYLALFAVSAAVLLLWMVVATNFPQGGTASSSSSLNRGVSTHSKSLLSTSKGSIGPGTQNAAAIPFVLPANLTAAWVNGSVTVTTCTPYGNCLAYAAVFTTSGWHAYLAGGAVTPIWCFKHSDSAWCEPEQRISVLSPNLAAYAGQTLVLCLWGGSLGDPQQYSAAVNIVWNAP
ncbi:MAG: hypothetical protein L3K14_00315 [Thermoplasmata archaeon]|nr:hypothetical protein [Thermoplasmata archaeon]